MTSDKYLNMESTKAITNKCALLNNRLEWHHCGFTFLAARWTSGRWEKWTLVERNRVRLMEGKRGGEPSELS